MTIRFDTVVRDHADLNQSCIKCVANVREYRDQLIHFMDRDPEISQLAIEIGHDAYEMSDPDLTAGRFRVLIDDVEILMRSAQTLIHSN